jgi:hypothetical protein
MMEDYFEAVSNVVVLAEHIRGAGRIQIVPSVPLDSEGKIGDVVIVL